MRARIAVAALAMLVAAGCGGGRSIEEKRQDVLQDAGDCSRIYLAADKSTQQKADAAADAFEACIEDIKGVDERD